MTTLLVARCSANNIVAAILSNLVFLSPPPDEVDTRFFIVVCESKLAVWFVQSKQIKRLWREKPGQLSAQHKSRLEGFDQPYTP